MKRTKTGQLSREPLTNSERMELLGCIIDVFEDFLEEKGIQIENDEREDDDNAAIIYGSDYDRLTSDVETILSNFDMLNAKCGDTGNECNWCKFRYTSMY